MRGVFPTKVILAATGVLSPVIASVVFAAAEPTPPPVMASSSLAAARVGASLSSCSAFPVMFAKSGMAVRAQARGGWPGG